MIAPHLDGGITPRPAVCYFAERPGRARGQATGVMRTPSPRPTSPREAQSQALPTTVPYQYGAVDKVSEQGHRREDPAILTQGACPCLLSMDTTSVV